MGKTSKPLSIIVDPRLMNQEWDKLIQQGHKISPMSEDVAKTDLVIGPNCWRMTPESSKYSKVAIERARAAKYQNGPAHASQEDATTTPASPPKGHTKPHNPTTRRAKTIKAPLHPDQIALPLEEGE